VATSFVLPEPLAIELPEGAKEIAPTEAPLRELLAAAKYGQRTVTNDLSHAVGLGPTRITWMAWDDASATGKPVAKASATLFVLPPGVAPVGLAGDEDATGGNNATKIARDSDGLVHMVWIDSARPGRGNRVLYRRAAVGPGGAVHWETEPIRVDDTASEAWNAYPGLAISGRSVHIAWQSGDTARYRRLDHDGTWTWGPVRNLEARSVGRDIGPAIAAMGNVIHIATPSGVDAVSADNGESWKADPIPLPAGLMVKTLTVVLDSSAVAHFAFSAIVHGPKNASAKAGSGGYWELRYIRRNRDGTWVDAQNVLAGRREWAEPAGDDDVLADWARLLVGEDGSLHLTWHGTAVSRIYANDRAYYARREANGPAAWRDGWETPLLLRPPDAAAGIKFSFAPSIALDKGLAMPLVFYDVYDGDRWAGFDAAARLIRFGKLEGKPLPVAGWVRASIDEHQPDAALSARFPAAAPSLFHAPEGHIWLDVLETLIPVGIADAPKLIAYQRVDVTDFVNGSRRQVAEASATQGPTFPGAPQATAEAGVKLTLGDILFYIPNLLERLWNSYRGTN
jgi:hypothetical protein